jgi:glucosamine--fructose-6-phosphate aminotransferase (isomerizing)
MANQAAGGSQMAAEMAEQPERLAQLVGRRRELRERLRTLFTPPLAGTVVVARGSSDHAATCGRYLLEMATKRPVASASPSVHLLYGAEVDFSGYVVIAVSQSGRTPEIASVLRKAGDAGARTIAITNDADSPLAAVADAVVALGVGEEKAVPATKTVTAEIAAFAMIADAIGDIGIPETAWGALPGQVSTVLEDGAPSAAIAAWLAGADRLATVARGLLFGAAAECALKLEETTGVLATGFSSADLRHGPIAIAATGIPIVALSHPGPAEADLHELIAQLRTHGANVRLLGPVSGGEAGWDAAMPEALAPVAAVVRGQQIARDVALLRGLDPDAPLGLSKVTIT